MKSHGILFGSTCAIIAMSMYAGIRREVVLNRRIAEEVRVEQAEAKEHRDAILAAINELRDQKETGRE